MCGKFATNADFFIKTLRIITLYVVIPIASNDFLKKNMK